MTAVALALALATTPTVQLSALAGRYRDYDLPLPPADAKLYRLMSHGWVEVGFPIATNPLGKPEKVLVGLNEERWHIGDDYTETELTTTNWNGLTSRGRWSEWLLAIQCEASGRRELALTAWNAFTKTGGNPADVRSLLAKKGWEWWMEQFQYRNADRAKVTRRLQLIAADCPNAADPELLRKLKLSLSPTDAKPGSVEALIDELLDVSTSFAGFFEPDELHPRVTAILRLGFDAVPALIEHLDDDRLTRSRTASGALNWDIRTSYPYSIKHFARDILYGYMVYDNAERRRIKGNLLTKEEAQEWWAEAKEEGEEVYMVRLAAKHCYNEYLLTVVEHKHPKRLPEVFAEVRKRDPYWIDLRPLVSALVRSSLDAAVKTKVLLEASESHEHQWQAAALQGLHQIDRDEFHKRLIAVLGDLPTWTDKKKREDLFPAYYTCIANTAMLTDDSKVWAAVGKYLETTDPEVKIEWVEHLARWTEPRDKCYRRVVECVAALLNDESFHVVKSGDEVRVHPVRNRAAEELGELLNVKAKPKPWTDDDWQAYRDEVAKVAKAAVKSGR